MEDNRQFRQMPYGGPLRRFGDLKCPRCKTTNTPPGAKPMIEVERGEAVCNACGHFWAVPTQLVVRESV
jgi:hypothetical protein